MIIVPNTPKPTKHNSGYMEGFGFVFGAKIADYGLCGYFARGLDDVYLLNIINYYVIINISFTK